MSFTLIALLGASDDYAVILKRISYYHHLLDGLKTNAWCVCERRVRVRSSKYKRHIDKRKVFRMKNSDEHAADKQQILLDEEEKNARAQYPALAVRLKNHLFEFVFGRPSLKMTVICFCFSKVFNVRRLRAKCLVNHQRRF